MYNPFWIQFDDSNLISSFVNNGFISYVFFYYSENGVKNKMNLVKILKYFIPNVFYIAM